MGDSFYRAFEERHRGTREVIKTRLHIYKPFLDPLKLQYPDAMVFDLGCGRGEWLQVLAEWGFAARGFDTDQGMLAACHETGLRADAIDAIEALQSAADESLAMVSAFHLAEHIPFPDLQRLVSEALRVLKPAGLLVLETPNPENIVVGTAGFYLDPTHHRPLPPGLLAFLPEHYGFHRTKVLRLQEASWLTAGTATSVLNVLRDTSADYAVIAQKDGAGGSLTCFDAAFGGEVGLTLEAVGTYYDANLEARARVTESLAQQALARAEQAESAATQAQADTRDALIRCQAAEQGALQGQASAREAQEQARQARAYVESLLASKSWRVTAPLRALVDLIKMIRGR